MNCQEPDKYCNTEPNITAGDNNMPTRRASTPSTSKHVIRQTKQNSCEKNRVEPFQAEKTALKHRSRSHAVNVRRMTQSSGRGRAYTTRVSFRVSVDVYRLLKGSVPNVSGFVRKVVYEAVQRLPVYYSMEEFQLEVEIARLADELGKVHRWQSLLLKHGSYAEAYLQKLKGGIVRDRKPHYLPEPPPFVKPEELLVVEDIVKYREKLAKQLVDKLNRVMQLKLSKSRDHMTNKPGKEVKTKHE